MAQQFEFAVERGLVGSQAGVLFAQPTQAGPDGHVILPGGLGAAEGVKQIELAFGAQERLVIVRAVQVHEEVAELLEHGERGRRTVDELPVAPGLGKRALDDEVAIDTAFEAVFFKFGVERVAIVDLEARFGPCRSPRRCG